MKEKGIITKQLDGDIYLCHMDDGRRYDIEISGYSGGETNLSFTLNRSHPVHGESIEIENSGFWEFIVQSEY